MAELRHSSRHTGQLTAIARLRWQLFLHSLRTTRGTAELISRIFIGFVIAVAGIGGAIGMGVGAWSFVSNQSPQWIALLLWSIFMFWQFFPVMATAFTQSTDSSVFLRFPLSYRAYFLVVVAYGAFDIATALGSLWLLGIWCGVAFADPSLAVWTAFILLTFALVNLILARAIFSWIERWLALRHTREILGIIFFLFVISFQFLGPLIGHFGRTSRPQVTHWGAELSPAQRVLPPGLAAAAMAEFHASPLLSAGYAALLACYGVALLGVLHVRLRAQYRGEDLSEAGARSDSRAMRPSVRRGWKLPGFPVPIAAILEKELLYLSRSGPMLFTLIMPLVMLGVFRVGGSGREAGLLTRAPDFALPTGAAYAVLMLTNLVYNNFGADGAGVQFLFTLPVRFRQVVVAKNLAHAAVLAGELVLVWVTASLLYTPPRLDITIATLAGVLFVLPVNLVAGNFLSLYSPKRIEFSTFGRQRAPQTTILASFAVQICVFGLAAIVLWSVPHQNGYWLASLVLLCLATIALGGYLSSLNHLDRLAHRRQETLIAELCRA